MGQPRLNLEDLPEEIIINIFSLLSPVDLLHILEIPNKRLKNLAQDKCLYSKLNLGGDFFLCDSDIKKILAFGLTITTTELSLSYLYQLKVSHITKYLKRNLTGLRKLDLTGLSLSNSSLATMLGNLSHLDSLGITASKEVPLNDNFKPYKPFTAETVMALSRLKHLKITVGYDCVNNSLLPVCTSLQTLVLDSLSLVKERICCCMSGHLSNFEYCTWPETLQFLYIPSMLLGRTHHYWNHLINVKKLYSDFNILKPKWRNCSVHIGRLNVMKSRMFHPFYCPHASVYIRKDLAEQAEQANFSPFVTFYSVTKSDHKPGTPKSNKNWVNLGSFASGTTYHQANLQNEITDIQSTNVMVNNMFIELGATRTEFAKSLSKLKELPNAKNLRELWLSLTVKRKENVSAATIFQPILQCKQLTHLNLDMILMDANMMKSFIELVSNCYQLQSFCFQNTERGGLDLSSHLGLAIKKMKHLKDLRIEFPHFNLNCQFFQSLQQCHSLSRLVIITEKGESTAGYNLMSLFEKCQQLIFVYFNGFTHRCCNLKQGKELTNKIIERFIKHRPGISIHMQEGSGEYWKSIPPLHWKEMVDCEWMRCRSLCI